MADVLQCHATIFGLSVQRAALRLRDARGLDSALARPRHFALYQEADLALQTAVLAHGIAEGQLFLDGNKRTALVAALLFLDLNGYVVRASQQERESWIIALSSVGTPEELAEHIRATIVPKDGGP